MAEKLSAPNFVVFLILAWKLRHIVTWCNMSPPKSAPPKASLASIWLISPEAPRWLKPQLKLLGIQIGALWSFITDFIIYLFQYHGLDKGSEFRYKVSWLVFSFCWDLFCFTRFGSTCWHSMLGERHLSWLSLTSRTLGACNDNNLHQLYVMNL